MDTMVDSPVIVFFVSVAVLGSFYAYICLSVPRKRSLTYKGRLALYAASSTIGTITVCPVAARPAAVRVCSHAGVPVVDRILSGRLSRCSRACCS